MVFGYPSRHRGIPADLRAPLTGPHATARRSARSPALVAALARPGLADGRPAIGMLFASRCLAIAGVSQGNGATVLILLVWPRAAGIFLLAANAAWRSGADFCVLIACRRPAWCRHSQQRLPARARGAMPGGARGARALLALIAANALERT